MLSTLSSLHLLNEKIHSRVMNVENTECIYYIQSQSTNSFKSLYMIHCSADGSTIFSIETVPASWIEGKSSYYCSEQGKHWSPPVASEELGEVVSFWHYVKLALDMNVTQLKEVLELRDRIRLIHCVDEDTPHPIIVHHTTTLWMYIRKGIKTDYTLGVSIYKDIKDQVNCYYRTVGGMMLGSLGKLLNGDSIEVLSTLGKDKGLIEILGRLMTLAATPKYQDVYFSKELFRTTVQSRSILDIPAFENVKERLGEENILKVFNILSNPFIYGVKKEQV